MVKRKWLWGKRSCEKMGGETESSGSLSSQSEKYSDDQDDSRGSQSNSHSPEITSKETDTENNREEMNDKRLTVLAKKLSDTPIDDGSSQDSLSQEDESKVSTDTCSQVSDSPKDDKSTKSLSEEKVAKICVDDASEAENVAKTNNDCEEDNSSSSCNVKLLTEKLSAALLNVSLKDDLVKQHAKVAEEAVAGWEKAEKEVTSLRQQLETTTQQKSTVEARANHLDEALKECVRQLRLARDEQERKINQAVSEKTNELVHTKINQLMHRLETLERENSLLRRDLQAQSDELEIRTIERDLSTKAAETASKQHLESIKKVAKLESECRRLKSVSRVSSYAESLTDSHSDSGDQQSNPSWASALIAELDQFKTEKVGRKGSHPSPPVEIDLMDDFLEMERLAGFPTGVEKPVHERDGKLRIIEAEKDELRTALAQTRSCFEISQVELIETHMKLEQLEEEAKSICSTMNSLREELDKERVFSVEARENGEKLKTMEIALVEAREYLEKSETKLRELEREKECLILELDRERGVSVEKSSRCEELENELERKKNELGELRETREGLEMKLGKLKRELNAASEEKGSLRSQLDSVRTEVRSMSSRIESLEERVFEERAKCMELENALHQKANTHNELKLKQEDLEAAAGKLADCQKTIAALGTQLKSLATLEDFLIDTASIPGFSPPAPLMARRRSSTDQPWKLHSNHTFLPGKEYGPHEGPAKDTYSHSSSSSSSAYFMNPSGCETNPNGFAKYFSLSRN